MFACIQYHQLANIMSLHTVVYFYTSKCEMHVCMHSIPPIGKHYVATHSRIFLYQQMRDACLHAFNPTNWQTLCRYTQSYISCSKCSISTIDYVKIFLILTIILIMSRNVKEHQ